MQDRKIVKIVLEGLDRMEIIVIIDIDKKIKKE